MKYYIVGRKKDVIIKAGRNIYPTEIEEITEQVPGVRKGCVAAFGVPDSKHGTEKLIVVAETHEINPEARQQMINEILRNVNSVMGMPPDEVILVPPRTIPKTSSGKLRRSACLTAYTNNRLGKRFQPAWWQVIKLYLSGSLKKIPIWIESIGKSFYTVYLYLILLSLLPVWVSSGFISRRNLAKLTKLWARMLIRLAGCPLQVTGQENLTKFPSMIFVSNHASYTDAIVLTAILPAGSLFIAKQELLKAPIVGDFIRRMGHLTVNRMDFSQSLSDTEKLQKVLQEGHSLVIFPEGTLTYATGLRTFKMGAFKIAIETGTAICPVALQGTRQILRNGSHLIRPGLIKVHISEPIMPKSKEWTEGVRLRDEARKAIAEYCGEPTIDLIRAGYEEK